MNCLKWPQSHSSSEWACHMDGVCNGIACCGAATCKLLSLGSRKLLEFIASEAARNRLRPRPLPSSLCERCSLPLTCTGKCSHSRVNQ